MKPTKLSIYGKTKAAISSNKVVNSILQVKYPQSMSWAESKEAGQGRGELVSVSVSVDWFTKSSPGLPVSNACA